MVVVVIIIYCTLNTLVEPSLIATNRTAAPAMIKQHWDVDEPIEYSFDGSFTVREQNFINLAVEYWQNGTCLNFELRDDVPHWNRVVFEKSSGCFSVVGRQNGNDVQYVDLASSCSEELGDIAHEIGHVLGLQHTHVCVLFVECTTGPGFTKETRAAAELQLKQRADRDSFVEIKWNNIEASLHSNYELTYTFFDIREIPYDFGSVMHYAGYRRDNQWTQSIKTKMEAYQLTIGDTKHLSFYDLKTVNVVYKCEGLCSNQLACQRNGFINSKTCDSCWCPEGFTGTLCEKIMPPVGRPCGGTITIQSSYFFIGTPGWPYWPREKLEKGQECTWLLKAPEKKIIEFRFRYNPKQFVHMTQILVESSRNSWFEATHEKNYCKDYVEVNNSSDLANTGMRFCGHIAPGGPIYSETNEMMVLFRSMHGRSMGFGAVVAAIDPDNRSNEAFRMTY